MNTNYAARCLIAALPLAIAPAFAQTQSTAKPLDEGVYTLKVPTAPVSQVSGSGYELSGTTISGSTGSSSTMLTAPVGNAAPYKTESGIYLYPSLFVGMGYNDNVTSSATNKISSNLVNIEPQLIAELKHKGDRYTALALVNNLNYASSSADNSTNSEFTVAGDNYFTARARAAWSLGQVQGTDARGANNRAISAEPDRWTSNNVAGTVIYGAAEAPMRFEFDLGNQAKTYNNNRASTAIADVTVGSYAARGFYRLGTRSLALVEMRNANANYNSSLATDSNTERRYYVGLTWDATAATTGIVKVGRMTKDFDLAGRDSYSGGSWEASVRWMPLTYSSFDLQTARSTADASGFGNYLLTNTTNLTWNHKWNQSVSSRAAIGVLKTEYAGTTRDDSTTSVALGVDYSLRRWLTVGLDWAMTDNTSNVAAQAYKRNVTMLTLNATL